jgi:hypothetical protein
MILNAQIGPKALKPGDYLAATFQDISLILTSSQNVIFQRLWAQKSGNPQDPRKVIYRKCD